MKQDVNSIVAFYEKSGEIRYNTTLSGDYKTGNIETPKLARMFRLFEQDRTLARECISKMLESKNVVVRTDAAAYCLALNENVEIGEKVLKEISDDPANGIFGFNAQMTLNVWQEQGELRMYQKIKI